MGMTVKTPNTTVSNKAFGWDTYTYTVTRDEHSAPVGAVWTSLMIFRSTVIHSYLQCSHNKGAFSYISISCDNALVFIWDGSIDQCGSQNLELINTSQVWQSLCVHGVLIKKLPWHNVILPILILDPLYMQYSMCIVLRSCSIIWSINVYAMMCKTQCF